LADLGTRQEPPDDFPIVRAATAERIIAFDACRGLGFQPSFDGSDCPIQGREDVSNRRTG
jgi:hypothetical protein